MEEHTWCERTYALWTEIFLNRNFTVSLTQFTPVTDWRFSRLAVALDTALSVSRSISASRFAFFSLPLFSYPQSFLSLSLSRSFPSSPSPSSDLHSQPHSETGWLEWDGINMKLGIQLSSWLCRETIGHIVPGGFYTSFPLPLIFTLSKITLIL